MKSVLCGALAVAALLAAPALAQDKTTIRFANIFDGPTAELWAPVLAGLPGDPSRHRSEVGERRRQRRCGLSRRAAHLDGQRRSGRCVLHVGRLDLEAVHRCRPGRAARRRLRRQELDRPVPGLDGRSPEAGWQAVWRALPRPGHGPVLPQGSVRAGRHHGRAEDLRRSSTRGLRQAQDGGHSIAPRPAASSAGT